MPDIPQIEHAGTEAAAEGFAASPAIDSPDGHAAFQEAVQGFAANKLEWELYLQHPGRYGSIMINLKLTKLPDRTPTKITITVNADLDQALYDYQKLYVATYGALEKISDLIPFMLEAFLNGDYAFAKARKEGLPEVDADTPAPRARSPRVGDAAPTSPVGSSTPRPQED